MMKCYIKENSFIAKVAAKKLGASSVAIVIGNTIHLHNTSKEQFIKNERWVRHEAAHLKQFRHHGYFSFIIKYLWESIKMGYQKNKYEIEARAAENNNSIRLDIDIIN